MLPNIAHLKKVNNIQFLTGCEIQEVETVKRENKRRCTEHDAYTIC